MRSRTIDLLDCCPEELLSLKSADGRTLAQVFAHVHDGLCTWMEGACEHWSAQRFGESAQPSYAELRAALVASGRETVAVFRGRNGQLLERLVPPVGTGADLIGYMVAHEAHHHGEVSTVLLLHHHGELYRRLWHHGDDIK